jgi:enoyl-CoA hydratase/3-hydroxyacyl-CoA dehydrogenase
LFQKLAPHLKPTAILATNTSSLSVTELARGLPCEERVVGLHYFFPAAVNKLLEVVKGAKTRPEVFEAAWSFGQRTGKVTIETTDSPGFCVNRFFVPLMNEAARLHGEGVDVPTVEIAANEAFGTSMGPMMLMNVTGVPISLHAETTLYEKLGKFYEPSPVLRKQVESKKNWDVPKDLATIAVDPERKEAVKRRLLGVAFGIAAQLVEEGVATREDTDKGALVGLRWDEGPFAKMNRLGTAAALQMVELAHQKHKEFAVPKTIREHGQANKPFVLSNVHLKREGHVGIITIDRPEAMNALNEKVIADLDRVIGEIENSDLRAVVITGAGSSFVAGADIKKMVTQTAVESRVFTKFGSRTFRRLEKLAQPVIAAVNGYALGGGCELVLACDIVIASEKAVFGLPEVNLAIHPGFGGSIRLPRIVGLNKAKELILTGDHVKAAEAERIGLVNKVVPADRLLAEAKALANKIAEKGPVAIAQAKGVLNRALDLGVDEGLDLETESVTICFSTEDQKEGMRAFLEKRKPAFKGR